MLIRGMLGLGDNLHQRAVVRHFMAGGKVTLETPWPQIYHDLAGDKLELIPSTTSLRTQAKNVQRGSDLYSGRNGRHSNAHKVWYTHDQIRQCGGFLAAMCKNSRVPKGDFSLPVPESWKDKARAMLPRTDKPILVYRPLVSRREWDGCQLRNPDAEAYTALIKSIKSKFFVVSVADLVPMIEWTESDPIGADIEFHAGQLDVEALVGMVGIASMTWCSPGFMLVMSQALRKPMVAVFGGHESARLYYHGYEENLFIQPGKPCECFNKRHRCDKVIDMVSARDSLAQFVESIV